VLAATGCGFGDVVDVTVFIVDPKATFERIWETAREYWGETAGRGVNGFRAPNKTSIAALQLLAVQMYRLRRCALLGRFC